MSEVLSQNEIDALLKALSTGEVDVQEIKEENKDKKIKKYDFRNPQKIAKDQMRTLEIIHDNFGRLLQTFLSGYLRAPVKISLLTVDQYAYSEFSNAVSNPAFLSVINFDPLPGQIIMDISSKIAFVIIDRLLGGDGEKADEVRNFTEIELTLLKRMLYKVNELISQAWENVIPLTPNLEKIETNSQFAQIVSPSETIALITMNISIGSVEGMINLCIPHIVIESILNRLSTKLWFSNTKKDISSKDAETIRKRLRSTTVMLKGELGRTVVTVKELLELQVGDVVKLNSNVEEMSNIYVGNDIKFTGVIGNIRNKIALKIVDVKKDGDDKDDK